MSGIAIRACGRVKSFYDLEAIPDSRVIIMMTTAPDNSPVVDLIIIAIGILLFIFRNEIGSFTGYYVGRGKYVGKPTPGCLLIPFALAFIVGGTILLIRYMTGG